MTRYSLAGARIRDIARALAAIDGTLASGVATPNHILSITPVWPCPATEPEGVPPGRRRTPAPCDGGGSGVFIYVADTGLLEDAAAHPWLAGVTGQEDELPPPDGAGVVMIPDYTGPRHVHRRRGALHGAGRGGVCHQRLRQGRRAFRVRARRSAQQALGLGANIISLSAGGTTRQNLPLLGFESFWSRYRHCKGTLLVAAAGNNSTRRPFWPAAFPQVVGVGALAANWRGTGLLQ